MHHLNLKLSLGCNTLIRTRYSWINYSPFLISVLKTFGHFWYSFHTVFMKRMLMDQVLIRMFMGLYKEIWSWNVCLHMQPITVYIYITEIFKIDQSDSVLMKFLIPHDVVHTNDFKLIWKLILFGYLCVIGSKSAKFSKSAKIHNPQKFKQFIIRLHNFRPKILKTHPQKTLKVMKSKIKIHYEFYFLWTFIRFSI